MALELALGFGQLAPLTVANPLPSDGDAVLVHAARAGDREAFGRLYERHSRMVHGVLLARAPRQEADDLVQDVFLLAMRRLPSLRDAGAFGPWLAAIARNRAVDHFRSRREGEEVPDELPGAPHPEDDGRRVIEAIRSLPEAYRETLVLRLVEGMTGPEIAERTGLAAASVRVNLHGGMKLLRERLSGRGSA
jgi:RNA polymerase sigma-70 factor (ECF subfamily)